VGRPLKNRSHPLARLREQLSGDSAHKMTRQELSKKTGIPDRSLQDIEGGKYNLTHGVAIQISLGTGVHPDSLMNGDDPLLDFERNRLAPGYMKLATLSSLSLEARKQLYLSAMEAAIERGVEYVVQYSFEMWLRNTCEKLGLKNLLIEKLTERLGLFDPKEISPAFRPKNKLAQKWKVLQEQIDEKQRHWEQEAELDDAPKWVHDMSCEDPALLSHFARIMALQEVSPQSEPGNTSWLTSPNFEATCMAIDRRVGPPNNLKTKTPMTEHQASKKEKIYDGTRRMRPTSASGRLP
jgi:transcriptional regulator with XRE-family HTH domain